MHKLHLLLSLLHYFMCDSTSCCSSRGVFNSHLCTLPPPLQIVILSDGQSNYSTNQSLLNHASPLCSPRPRHRHSPRSISSMHSVYHRPHQRTPSPTCTLHLQLHHLPSHSYVDPIPICCRALPLHGFLISPLWWWRWRWLCGGDCGDIVLVVVDGTAGWHWSVMVRDRGRYRAVTVWW
jgi:hypothetical protein